MDQQVKTGIYDGLGSVREIRDGKLGAILEGASILINSSSLWKNVIALGGDESAKFSAIGEGKGEPSQKCLCTVRSGPVKVKDCAVIDGARRV
jgi:predicted Zn-dependent protease